MVSIIENSALVHGLVNSCSAEPDIKGFCEISLKLITSTDLNGMPNLARADEGKDVRVKIREDKLRSLNVQPGSEITIAVRKAFGQIYFLQEQ